MAKPPSPTRANASSIRGRALSFEIPASRSGSQTLAKTFDQGISVGSWKTKPNCGRSQLQSIFPRVGSVRPVKSLSTVDLPQPDGPSSDRNSPVRISRSSPVSAVTELEKTLSTCLKVANAGGRDFAGADPPAVGNVTTLVMPRLEFEHRETDGSRPGQGRSRWKPLIGVPVRSRLAAPGAPVDFLPIVFLRYVLVDAFTI